MEICKKYPPIGFIWNWLELTEEFRGIGEILEESKSTQKSKGTFAQYSSVERSKCLQFLGWPETPKALQPITKKLVEDGQFERAAFISVAFGEYQRAVDALKVKKNEHHILYSILKSMLQDGNKMPIQKLCIQLEKTEKISQYDSAILLFIGITQNIKNICEKLAFPDNLAFACMFFSDDMLRKTCKSLIEAYKLKGDLNGVVISGFNQHGMDIMEAFLTNTADIQTVGLLSIFAKSSGSMSTKLNTWLESYKSKLNSLELWNFRAKLEIDECRMLKIPYKDNTRPSKCNCGTELVVQTSNNTQHWIERDYGKKNIITCDNCPGANNNLCCSVCLLPYFTPSSVSSFDIDRPTAQEDWFVWCESCNHGAHADHLMSWFQEYKKCPVVGCPCTCAEICRLDESVEISRGSTYQY